jgi:hypothetical protein
MTIVNTKTLTDLLVIPTYESDTNVIKRVSFDIKVYDDAVGPGTNVTVPVQSVLSTTDLEAGDYITVDGSITQTGIVNWAYDNVGGDSYYDSNIKPLAESKLNVELEFAGTSDFDVSVIAT